ncbi:MAG: hypothetical protein ABIG67_05825 [Pseudomonadota bacterium]
MSISSLFPRAPSKRTNSNFAHSAEGLLGRKMAHIWVVEILENGKWLPTTGVASSMREARDEKDWWVTTNPQDKYRIKKYVREGKI